MQTVQNVFSFFRDVAIHFFMQHAWIVPGEYIFYFWAKCVVAILSLLCATATVKPHLRGTVVQQCPFCTWKWLCLNVTQLVESHDWNVRTYLVSLTLAPLACRENEIDNGHIPRQPPEATIIEYKFDFKWGWNLITWAINIGCTVGFTAVEDCTSNVSHSMKVA